MSLTTLEQDLIMLAYQHSIVMDWQYRRILSQDSKSYKWLSGDKATPREVDQALKNLNKNNLLIVDEFIEDGYGGGDYAHALTRLGVVAGQDIKKSRQRTAQIASTYAQRKANAGIQTILTEAIVGLVEAGVRKRNLKSYFTDIGKCGLTSHPDNYSCSCHKSVVHLEGRVRYPLRGMKSMIDFFCADRKNAMRVLDAVIKSVDTSPQYH